MELERENCYPNMDAYSWPHSPVDECNANCLADEKCQATNSYSYFGCNLFDELPESQYEEKPDCDTYFKFCGHAGNVVIRL